MFGLMEASARRRAVGVARSSSAAAGRRRGEGGFTMAPRRLVLACEVCPETKPSRTAAAGRVGVRKGVHLTSRSRSSHVSPASETWTSKRLMPEWSARSGVIHRRGLAAERRLELRRGERLSAVSRDPAKGFEHTFTDCI